MLVDISDKVIVITGASRGIGSEIAKSFSKEGANVVINYYKSENEARKLWKSIIQYNSKCIMVYADVRNREDVFNLYQQTISKFGKVDILINNAGICDDSEFVDMTVEKWESVIDVNLNGVFNCTKIFIENMIKNKYGKVINIASYKGLVGSNTQANYCASKSAIVGFTKSIAKELGKNNVTINVVCPGFIITDLNKNCEKKKYIAKKNSVMDISNNMNELVNFLMYLCKCFKRWRYSNRTSKMIFFL